MQDVYKISRPESKKRRGNPAGEQLALTYHAAENVPQFYLFHIQSLENEARCCPKLAVFGAPAGV